jgi:hypothetical protein
MAATIMSDNSWMRWNNKPSPPSHPPREEVFGFAMAKDVRTMTGFLRRVDEERWEAVYEANGTLYMSETLASRELAERHLAKHKDLLEAAGWRER